MLRSKVTAHGGLGLKMQFTNPYSALIFHQRRHRRYLWELFTSSNVDPELRITSYLAVARCADVVLLRKVLDYVDSMVDDARNRDNEDKVKVSSDAEVKAFVYSHLTHIRDSSSPHKQQLKEEVKR